MSASHKNHDLPAYRNIPTQAVSGNVTSAPTQIFHKDNIGIQVVWTGTLAGSFDPQVSIDYNHDTGVGNWDSVPALPAIAAVGSPGHGTFDLKNLPSGWIRIVFNYTSGAGNLTSNITAKAL